MAGFDLTTMSTMLKDFYLGKLRLQFNNKNILRNRLKKVRRNVVGNQYVIPLLQAPLQSIGSRASVGATLPAGGNPTYNNAKFNVTFKYAVVKLEVPAIEASKTDRGSFVSVMQEALARTMEGLTRDINREMHGVGTGSLAIMPAADNNDPLTVTPKNYVPVNAICDLIDATDGTTKLLDSRTIDSSTIAGEVGYTGAVVAGTDTGDFWVREDSNALEANGLQNLIGSVTGIVGGINKATAGNEFWQPNVDSTTTVLTLKKIQDRIDAAEEVGDGTTTLILTTFAIKSIWYDLLQADKRHMNTLKLDGGFTALDHNSIPVVVDRDTQDGHVYFIDESGLQIYQNNDLSWMDHGGNQILQQVAGEAAYQAVLYYFWQFGGNSFNTQSALTAITG